MIILVINKKNNIILWVVKIKLQNIKENTDSRECNSVTMFYPWNSIES